MVAEERKEAIREIIKGLEEKGLYRVNNRNRPSHLKSMYQLNKLKREPIAEAIAYGQQKYDSIFYLYDIRDTIPSDSDALEKIKLEQKKYREDLKRRKTCSRCGNTKKSLYNVSVIEGKIYCNICIEERR